ncbi:hypothetical protein BKA93DRAFT_752913 [Sparassis latifolia]
MRKSPALTIESGRRFKLDEPERPRTGGLRTQRDQPGSSYLYRLLFIVPTLLPSVLSVAHRCWIVVLFFLRRRCLRDEAKAKAKAEDEDKDKDGDVAQDQHRGSPIRMIPVLHDGRDARPSSSQGYNDLTSWAMALPRADEVSPFDGLLAAEFPLRDDGMAAVLEADVMVLWDKIRLWEWEVDSTCSVPDLGFLMEEKFNALAEAALQCLDHLHLLPMTCTHAITLGAHVQCLTLELWGFVNYCTVITKTEKTKIEKWASPVLVSYELSLNMSWPHLLRHEMDLAGILHRAGKWPTRMLHEAMCAVCTAGLPPLEGASEVSTAEQPPQKKQKEDKLPSAQLPTVQQGDGRANLQPSGSAESAKKSKCMHRSTRGKKNCNTKSSSLGASQPAHPSLLHKSSVLLGDAWNTTLLGVSPLMAPPRAATYFFPPPFVLDCTSDKLAQYLHNFRDALWGDYSLDKTAKGQSAMSATLTLGEGEAPACEGASTSSGDGLSDVNTASLVTRKSSTAKKAKDKHEQQQNICQLFSATGRMSLYDETMELSWGEDLISLDNVVDICEQILWELHETNWCYDIAFYWVRAPAPGWNQSRPCLSAFLAVMQRWPDVPEDLRIDVDTLLICEADEYNCLQDSIVRFNDMPNLIGMHYLCG